MFELDELLKLTKLVEATSTNVDTTVEEEDLPAAVRTYDDGDYSGKATVLRTRHGIEDDIPQKPTDGKAYGSSGNATFTDEHGNPIKGGPLFEEDGPTTDPEQEPAENPDAGLAKMADATDTSTAAINDAAKAVDDLAKAEGDNEPNSQPADTQCMSSIGKSLKRGFGFGLGESVERGMGREFCSKYMLENAEGFAFRRNDPFKLGDVVQADSIPMLFVVKDNDGSIIKTAKPTCRKEDQCCGKDGVWPEFCFQQSDLHKVDNANLTHADYLAKFNDRDIARGFDGRTIDPAPMELAQDFAKNQTFDDIGADLDNILGDYWSCAKGGDPDYCYEEVSPTTTYVLPSGEVTTKSMKGGYKVTY